MPTITIEFPDEVSVGKFEAQLANFGRQLGLQPRFKGFRNIKFVTLNPNAVDQRIRRHLHAIPTLRELADGSRIGKPGEHLLECLNENVRALSDIPPHRGGPGNGGSAA